jgi:transketolase
VVIEKYEGINAEEIYKKVGAQPHRNKECGICCSTGSLGQGLPIALGMALADRTKNVYCLISDGEMFEGTMWETANVMRKYKVTNLKIYLNFNGWAAYDKVEEWMLNKVMDIFPTIRVRRTKVEDYGLKGLSAHYIQL